MRFCVGLVLLTGACGSVDTGTNKMDAPPAQIDAPGSTCTVHNQVNSCGPTCVVCTAATDRETPTCDGTSCGMACANGNPRCSDNSCSRLNFGFEADKQGATIVTPANMPINHRMHNGSMALAFDFMTNLANTQLEFTVPVCLTGAIGQSTKTLKAQVYFEGGTADGDQYYVQGSVPTPTTGNYLSTQGAARNITEEYSQPLSQSAGSSSFNNITFRIGSFGGEFIGTVWVDNIRIE